MADMKAQVAAKVAEMEQHLARSGGHVELVELRDGIARVRVSLTRPAAGRPVASLQLASGIERALRHAVPDLRGVEAVNLPPHTLAGWDEAAS